MTIKERIVKLTRQLYPTGLAFKMPVDGFLYGLHNGLAESEAQAYQDAIAILNSILPDNVNFTIDDATDWERRLALPTNSSIPLEDRKAAILRKMRAPGVQPAKGHYLYIQTQLRLANFDVYVYENMFPLYPSGFGTYNPVDLNPNILTQIQQGDVQQGDSQQGGFLNNVVANYVSNLFDRPFVIGSIMRSTFFVGGPVLGQYATVPVSREQEFRQLLLSLKQVQDIGILFIQYV